MHDGFGRAGHAEQVRDQELRAQARRKTQMNAVLVTPFIAPRHPLPGICPALTAGR
jgi:hypothetical protein